MKEYRGHLLPSDLYYLLLSYCDKTDWEWYVSNGLAEWQGCGYMLVAELTNDQLNELIQSAIQWNLNQVIHKDDVTLEDIEKIGK